MAHVPALDGLRGVAVAAVVAYHLEPNLVPGGFLGVDVFFVLSGFLIGSLLIREVEETGTVNLRNFYLRRIRRLTPAVLVVLCVVAIYSATLAGVSELSRLRTHSLWTLGWLANWRYIADGTAYTDLIAGSSPLRHTWSLSIEEQFYAAFPLIVLVLAMVVARRRGVRRMRAVLGGVSLVGLALSAIEMVVFTIDGRNIDRAYFGTDTRLQALLAGVLIASVFVGEPPRTGAAARVARVLAVPSVVITMLLFGVAGERELWMYRGGFTLIAMVSAFVVVGVNSSRWLSVVLSWKPLVGLGQISYGVYLWHWPILVVFDAPRVGRDGWRLTVFRLALTMTAAMASWWFVERPIRRGALGRAIGRWAVGIAVVSIAFVAAISVWSTTRPNEPLERESVSSVTSSMVTIAGMKPLSMVLVGDSVAHTLAGSKVYEFPKSEVWKPADSPFDPAAVSLWSVAKPACSFLPGSVTYRTQAGMAVADLSQFCGDWQEDVRRAVVERSADVLVVLLTIDAADRVVDGETIPLGSVQWSILLTSTLEEFRTMAAGAGARLVLLTPPPRVGRSAPQGEEAGVRERQFSEALNVYAMSRTDVTVIDFADAVCPSGDCSRSANGFDPVWRYDGRHFTTAGAKWFAAWLTPQLQPTQSSN